MSRLGIPISSPHRRGRLVAATAVAAAPSSSGSSSTAPSSPAPGSPYRASASGTSRASGAASGTAPGAASGSASGSGPRPLRALIRARTPDLLAGPAGSPSKRILAPSQRVCVLQDKLSEAEVDRIRGTVSGLGAMNVSLDYATVVLCETRAPKRAERALGEEAKQRGVPVLHHSWLNACLEAGIQVPHEAYQVWPPLPSSAAAGAGASVSAAVMESEKEQGKEKKQREEEEGEKEKGKQKRAASSEPEPRRAKGARLEDEEEEGGYGSAEGEGGYGSHEEGTLTSTNFDAGKGLSPTRSPSRPPSRTPTPPPPPVPSGPAPAWQNHTLACFRPTPLRSTFNQALVDELEVIRVSRVLSEKSGARDAHNSAAYGRAISAIKSYPHPLSKNPKAAKEIAGVGPKIYRAILQFYELGYVAEARSIRGDAAHKVMRGFMDFYGVGPSGARKAYQQGARSLSDLCKLGQSYADRLGREECLRILPDLLHRIPRAECEGIAALVHQEFEKLHPGMKYTICGGYRRGKATSGDVDIVLSPDPDQAPVRELKSLKKQTELLHQVLEALKKKVSVAQPSEYYGEKIFPHCDIAEIVVLPTVACSSSSASSGTGGGASEAKRPRYRRVDIILTRPEVYGATVLGWTGSKQFEKDIRRHAKAQGYKFHSTGLVRLAQPLVALETPREEDVFEALGVPYMPPHLRNCDA